MANIKSQKKRILITKEENAKNTSLRTKCKNAVKKYEAAIAEGNIALAEELLPVTVSTAVLTGESAANYSLSQPEGITVNITKGKAETPESVFIEDKTETSITVEAIYGAEYSIDGVNWQDSNVFEGLCIVNCVFSARASRGNRRRQRNRYVFCMIIILYLHVIHYSFQ